MSIGCIFSFKLSQIRNTIYTISPKKDYNLVYYVPQNKSWLFLANFLLPNFIEAERIIMLKNVMCDDT